MRTPKNLIGIHSAAFSFSIVVWGIGVDERENWRRAIETRFLLSTSIPSNLKGTQALLSVM